MLINKQVFSILMKLAVVVLLISLLATVSVYFHIQYYGRNSVPEESDVIIVLGCQIWGMEPSWSLRYRLERALELYDEGYGKNIIVSGGQGRDEITTESSVMKAWLVKHGIDEGIIYEEDKSTSTYENLLFSKAIMNENNMNTALIVSNDFHIFRALRIASKLDIHASGAPVPTVEHLKAYYRSREVLAVFKSIAFDR